MQVPLSTLSLSYFKIPSLESIKVKQRFSRLNNSDSKTLSFISALLLSTYFIKDLKYRSLAILAVSIAGSCFLKKLFTKQKPIQISPPLEPTLEKSLVLREIQILPLLETSLVLTNNVRSPSLQVRTFENCCLYETVNQSLEERVPENSFLDRLSLKIYYFLIQYTPLFQNLSFNNKRNLLDTLPLDQLSQSLRYLDLRSIFNALAVSKSYKENLLNDDLLLKDLYDSVNPQLTIDTSEEIIYSSTDPRKAIYPSLEVDNDPKSPQNKDLIRWLSNYGKTEYGLLKNPFKIADKLRSVNDLCDVNVLHLNDGKLITGNSKGGVTLLNRGSRNVSKKQYFFDSKITGVQVDKKHWLITTQSGNVKILDHQYLETSNTITSRHPISCAQMNQDYIVLGHSQTFSTPVHITLWNRNNFVPFMNLSSTESTEDCDVTSLQWDQDRVFYTLKEGQTETSQLYLWDIRTEQTTALLPEPFVNNLYAENYNFHKHNHQIFLAVSGGISIYDERFTKNPQMFIPTTQNVTSIQADSTKIVASTAIFNNVNLRKKSKILMWDRKVLSSDNLEPTRSIDKPYSGVSVCQFHYNLLAVGMYDIGHTAILEFLNPSYPI